MKDELPRGTTVAVAVVADLTSWSKDVVESAAAAAVGLGEIERMVEDKVRVEIGRVVVDYYNHYCYYKRRVDFEKLQLEIEKMDHRNRWDLELHYLYMASFEIQIGTLIVKSRGFAMMMMDRYQTIVGRRGVEDKLPLVGGWIGIAYRRWRRFCSTILPSQ